MNAQNAILLFLADTHCGSTTGLIRESWKLPSGGQYFPSFVQHRVWDQFAEGINRAVQLKKELKARLIVFVVGDPCDGDHHETTELITRDVSQHVGIHTDCMDWALQLLKPEKLFYVDPTASHNKPSLSDDCARDLGAVPYIASSEPGKKDGKWSWPEIERSVNGKIFNIVHQGANVSKSVWIEDNGLMMELKRIYWRSKELGKRPPDYYICAHRHKYITAQYKTIKGIILPSLQGKTEYGHSVSAFQLADIGMEIVVVRSDGSSWEECSMMELPTCEIEAL